MVGIGVGLTAWWGLELEKKLKVFMEGHGVRPGCWWSCIEESVKVNERRLKCWSAAAGQGCCCLDEKARAGIVMTEHLPWAGCVAEVTGDGRGRAGHVGMVRMAGGAREVVMVDVELVACALVSRRRQVDEMDVSGWC